MCLLRSRHSRAFSAASHFPPQATGWPHLSSREEPPEPRSHTNPTGPTQSQKSSTSKQVEEFLPLPNPALGSQTALSSQLMHSVVYAEWEKSAKWMLTPIIKHWHSLLLNLPVRWTSKVTGGQSRNPPMAGSRMWNQITTCLKLKGGGSNRGATVTWLGWSWPLKLIGISRYSKPTGKNLMVITGMPESHGLSQELTMTYRPNLACCLFWGIKFYWNTTTPICLCVVHGSFHAVTNTVV